MTHMIRMPERLMEFGIRVDTIQGADQKLVLLVVVCLKSWILLIYEFCYSPSMHIRLL